MSIRVKNLSGTTGKQSECCDSWKGHYRKNGGTAVKMCGVAGCRGPFDVGAHVINTHGNASSTHQIAPFCTFHNMQVGVELELKPYVNLVAANYCRRG